MKPNVRRQLTAIIAFLIVAGIFVLTLRVGVVHGNSMLPTYQDGESVLVTKITFGFSKGDVILLRKGSEVLIKRVVALAGEVISGPDAAIYERAEAYFETTGDPNSLKVPENSLVVLGDNAEVSEDSRVFGPVPLKDVLGKVVNGRPKQETSSAQPQ